MVFVGLSSARAHGKCGPVSQHAACQPVSQLGTSFGLRRFEAEAVPPCAFAHCFLAMGRFQLVKGAGLYSPVFHMSSSHATGRHPLGSIPLISRVQMLGVLQIHPYPENGGVLRYQGVSSNLN